LVIYFGFFYAQSEMGEELRAPLMKKIPISDIREFIVQLIDRYAIERVQQKYSKVLWWESFELSKPREFVTRGRRVKDLVGTDTGGFEYFPGETMTPQGPSWDTYLNNAPRPPPPSRPQPKPQPKKEINLPSDPIKALRVLNELLDKGEITESDYERLKLKILQSL
jgi:hypothetical protein